MNFLNYKNTLSILLLTIFLLPSSVFAQENKNTTIPKAIVVDEKKVYEEALNESSSSSNAAAAGASSFGACLASSALAGFVQSQISSVVSSSLDVFRVPTNSPVIEGKETGSIATGGLSWDQMGWCLANSLIEAISASTVQWINSGFQGNPAFVEDPAQYFTDIADAEAGAFLDQVSDGLLCSPIKDIVKIRIAQSYNSSISPYEDRAACTFTGVSGNIEQFMSGESFSWDDWISYTQDSNNNPYGATLNAQLEILGRTTAAVDVQSKLLNWGSGFFSKKDKEGKIISPGNVIENQVNERLFSGQRRIEIADEFNEVLNALVGQLIKMAVSEVTGTAY